MIKRSRRAAIYSRVSTDKQTTENQERELREIAATASSLNSRVNFRLSMTHLQSHENT